MKFLVIFLMSILSSNAMASTQEFSCALDSVKVYGKIYFQVYDLEDSTIAALNYAAYTDYQGREVAFSYEGAKVEGLWMMLIYGVGEDLNFDEDGNLLISIDNISCDTGKLKLFKNSQYKFGYLKVEHHCSDPNTANTFSNIECKITPH